MYRLGNRLNLLSLSVYQFSNSIIPLILFPYLALKLSDYQYSLVVVGEALGVIVLNFVIYSFDFSGVNELITQNNLVKSYVSKIFWKITVIRFLIYISITAIISAIIAIWGNPDLMIITFGWGLNSLSYIFQSFWFFQTREKYLGIAVVSFISRTLSLVLVYIFIYRIAFLYIPIIIGIVNTLFSLLLFLHTLKKEEMSFQMLVSSEIYTEIKNGGFIFVGNLSTFAYKEFCVVIAGIVGLSSVDIRALSISEKFVKIIQVLIRLINIWRYPMYVREFNMWGPNKINLKSILHSVNFFRLQYFVIIGAFVTILISYYMISHFDIVNLQELFKEAFKLTPIMMLALFFGVLNYIYGSIGMNVIASQRLFFICLVSTAIFSLACNLLLGLWLKSTGIAISFLFSEILLFVLVITTTKHLVGKK